MNCDFNCDICLKNHQQEFNHIKSNFAAIQGFDYDFNQHSTPTSMLLGLTNNCNLSCPYCFVQQNPAEMSLETAEKAVNWLINNYKIRENIPSLEKYEAFIGFFGGEPLLKYDDIIVPLVNKYKNIKYLSFGLTTNGTLLDEDKIDFFYQNNIPTLLSFDGIELIQNKQRPGKGFNSFQKVLKNIPYLLLRFPNTVMRVTITKESIPYIYETTMMAVELGFKQITFCPNAFEDWDNNDSQILQEQFDLLGEYIYTELMHNHYPIQINPLVSNFTHLLKLNNNNLKFENNILRCGLGTTSCAITPNGDIIPCQEKTSHPTIILGNISSGINPIKHKTFLENYFQKLNNISCTKPCNNKTKLICLTEICPSRLEDLNFTISSSNCIFISTSVQTTLRLYILCHHSPLPIIREYFNQEGLFSE